MEMSLSPTQFEGARDADRAFAQLVSGQVKRVTQEIQKLEMLLKAGMVDPEALREFRKAIDQVRKTSWSVQNALDQE
jgi:hypothetical protein